MILLSVARGGETARQGPKTAVNKRVSKSFTAEAAQDNAGVIVTSRP